MMSVMNEPMNPADPRIREAGVTIPVYGQLPFVPERASGCDIFTRDGRRILDLYGGHAVAALGYGHPRLVKAITNQTRKLLFQSNAVALDVRADAAEKLVEVAPKGLQRVFFVNSGAEANENALRMACRTTGRKKLLAITGSFHGRTAAAAAVRATATHSHMVNQPTRLLGVASRPGWLNPTSMSTGQSVATVFLFDDRDPTGIGYSDADWLAPHDLMAVAGPQRAPLYAQIAATLAGGYFIDEQRSYYV